jgi:hypothetical protein
VCVCWCVLVCVGVCWCVLVCVGVLTAVSGNKGRGGSGECKPRAARAEAAAASPPPRAATPTHLGPRERVPARRQRRRQLARRPHDALVRLGLAPPPLLRRRTRRRQVLRFCGRRRACGWLAQLIR